MRIEVSSETGSNTRQAPTDFGPGPNSHVATSFTRSTTSRADHEIQVSSRDRNGLKNRGLVGRCGSIRRTPIHTGLGDVRDHRGNEEEAIAKYREAIRLDPSMPSRTGTSVSSGTNRGKEDSAILEYQLAVRLDPMLTPLHCNVGPPLNRPRIARRAQRMTWAKFVRLRRVTDHSSLEASTYQRQRWPREHPGRRRPANGRGTLEAAIDAVSASMAAWDRR
jgi:hypothetical protein